jgi:uncharacterized protein (DUF488 family)
MAEFLSIVGAHQIEVIADVRSYPGSKRFPQFNREELAAALATNGVSYHHLGALGGRRRPAPDSHNTAWRHPAFRAYADYMESQTFLEGIESLRVIAEKQRTAIMCAEAVWWRCHRSLISDFLKAQGALVLHIVDAKRVDEHPFTAAARIVDGELTYRGLLP